jgi:hypothetical protein
LIYEQRLKEIKLGRDLVEGWNIDLEEVEVIRGEIERIEAIIPRSNHGE